MKLITLLFLIIGSLTACVTSNNLGHRLGADVITHLPENSLEVLKEALLDLQFQNDFYYIEFDIRESSTGDLVVFHDPTFTRMVGKKLNNEVKNTPFNEIRKYCLKPTNTKNCHQIPTPNEVLKLAASANVTKPIMIDIKNITTAGKNRLLATTEKYKDKLSINFIISKQDFRKIFNKKWCSDFSNKGYYVMQTRQPKNPETNNLCDLMLN